jgi:hypothetical protein
MHARVASFEGRDPSLADELIGTVREQVSTGRNAPPNARGFLMLVDRESGRSYGITFFDTEEHIREAEPVFERMGEDFPEEMRGRRVSVDSYEVAFAEGDENARAARVSLLESPPDRIVEGARYIEEEIVPRVRELPGQRGLISLFDRATGRSTVITLWESSEALRESEEQATELRQRAAEGASARIVGVERCEVAVAQLAALAVH